MLPDNMNPVPPQPTTPASEEPKEAPSRVITVRMTPTQWRAAKGAAHYRETSLNQWCVAQLERGIAEALEDAAAKVVAAAERRISQSDAA